MYFTGYNFLRDSDLELVFLRIVLGVIVLRAFLLRFDFSESNVLYGLNGSFLEEVLDFFKSFGYGYFSYSSVSRVSSSSFKVSVRYNN